MVIRFGVILLTALCLSACGSDSNPAPAPSPTPTPTPTPPPSGTTVSMVAGASTRTTTAFSPNPLTVAVGATVTWVNNDSTTHDAAANNGSFRTPLIAPGGSASVTLQTAGTITYFCTIHPGMVGSIVVQ